MPAAAGHFHAVPFQCKSRILGLGAEKVPVCPTAQALRPEVAATEKRTPPPAEVGLGTRVHAVPFQRRISVLGLRLPQALQPAAQTLDAEVAATASSAAPPAGFGLGTRVHAAPFQRRISVLAWVF